MTDTHIQTLGVYNSMLKHALSGVLIIFTPADC